MELITIKEDKELTEQEIKDMEIDRVEFYRRIKEYKKIIQEEIKEMEIDRMKFYKKIKEEEINYENNKSCIYCLMVPITALSPILIILGPPILVPYLLTKAIYYSLKKKKVYPEEKNE